MNRRRVEAASVFESLVAFSFVLTRVSSRFQVEIFADIESSRMAHMRAHRAQA
jgi:hypothetical protein